MAESTQLGIVALSIAECFGNAGVSPELVSSLRSLLPEATFVRCAMLLATLRSGTCPPCTI